jgi:tetratricopeptide (TPR) repeat protein
MAKKFKKDNKSRKDLSQKLQQHPPEHLIEQGKAFLERGKARDAIEVLKQAEKKLGVSDTVRQLLFRAYLMREEQLRSKGLIPEANAIKKLAIAVMPSPGSLTEADMVDLISCASVQDAVRLYIDFTKSHSPSIQLDQHVAYRLMMTDDWQPLEKLDVSHPLRRDSRPVQDAVPLMNQGDWENALQALKSVPRVSPYAPIRLFCRAMGLFYQENDSEMMQTLSRIPNDFPLISSIKSIQHGVGGLSDARPYIESCLWEGTTNPEKMAAAIIDCLKNRQIKQAATHISSFAKTIFPQSPVFATHQILEAIIFSSMRSHVSFDEFERFFASLLPSHQFKLLIAKAEIYTLDDLLQRVASYLDLLKDEIPNLENRNMVSGMLLLFAAKKMNSREFTDRRVHNLKPSAAKSLGFVESLDSADEVLLSLISRSIELDPLNRSAYELLIDTPRHSRQAKETTEKSLLKMSEVFPEDPFPCLELATLYYEKNAFRKAEQVLDEAARRAPHDNRVIDRRALSLVVAACKNHSRGKHHLVLSDMEKAEVFNSKRIVPIIAEKKILFDLMAQPDQIHKITIDVFQPLNLLDRLRAMGLLVQEVQFLDKIIKPRFARKMKDRLDTEIRRASLTPADVLALLSPFPKECRSILPSKHIAHILLSNTCNIFGVIPDADLIPTFELLFHQDIVGFMADELQKRLQKKDQPQSRQMQFFLITLKHMTGVSYCRDQYHEVVAKADAVELAQLETLSRKLSRHASGLLKSSLERFDFSVLEGNYPAKGFPGFPYPEGEEDFDEMDDDDDDEEDFDIDEMMRDIIPLLSEFGGFNKGERREIIKSVEDFVEETGAKGLPDEMIRELRNIARAAPQMRKMIDSMADFVRITALTTYISREAQILLFGKRQKK